MNQILPKTAKCQKCGYSICALPTLRCPECGHEFDPLDPRSYVDTSRQWWHLWLHPPSRISTTLAVAVIALYVFEESAPGDRVLVFIPYLFLVLIWDYMMRLVSFTCAYCQTESGYRKLFVKKHRIRWMIVPLCLAIALLAMLTEWPMKLRFSISERAFAREASNLPPNVTFRENVRIGLYHISVVERLPSGEVFFAVGTEGLTDVGFVYKPTQFTRSNAQVLLSNQWVVCKRIWPIPSVALVPLAACPPVLRGR